MNRIATFAAAALAGWLAATSAQAAEGEVRKLDRAQAKVTIAGTEVKNLAMPAMTMVYRAKPPTLLDGLAVGDRVEFTADKVDGQYVVTALKTK